MPLLPPVLLLPKSPWGGVSDASSSSSPSSSARALCRVAQRPSGAPSTSPTATPSPPDSVAVAQPANAKDTTTDVTSTMCFTGASSQDKGFPLNATLGDPDKKKELSPI